MEKTEGRQEERKGVGCREEKRVRERSVEEGKEGEGKARK